jgi:hypothetical protein
MILYNSESFLCFQYGDNEEIFASVDWSRSRASCDIGNRSDDDLEDDDDDNDD